MTAIIPINVDRNVSPAEFRQIAGFELLVTSMFYTFQGEGPYSGHPAVFVRLAGCNIGAKEDCPWCDTRFNFDEGTEMLITDVVRRVQDLGQGKAKLVVVTGGEPLLQSESLEELNVQLNAAGFHVQVETNGYFVKPDMLDGAMVVISPKIPHNKESYLPVRESWKLRHMTFLKYVVSADPDSPYFNLPEDALTSGLPIYVSGMAVYKRQYAKGEIADIWDTTMIDHEQTAANYKRAARLALEHGLRVSYQTHLFGAVE